MSRRCVSTSKLCWSSESRARAELASCRAQAAAGDPDRRETAVYRCSACGWWHLTSKPWQVVA